MEILEDHEIVELYFDRDERAISATSAKYGRYIRRVAGNILRTPADVDEVENDTYLGAWNAIPPQKPSILSSFLAKITRRLCAHRLRDGSAQKRGGGEITVLLDELSEILPDRGTVEQSVESAELSRAIDTFLRSQNAAARRIFIRRYFCGDSIREIADAFGVGESRVKMTLSRTRERLRRYLEKGGFTI